MPRPRKSHGRTFLQAMGFPSLSNLSLPDAHKRWRGERRFNRGQGGHLERGREANQSRGVLGTRTTASGTHRSQDFALLASYRVRPKYEAAIIDQLVKGCEKDGAYDDDRYTEGASAS